MAQTDRVVGIDVSKRKLDWCVRDGGHGVVENSAEACKALVKELRQLGVGTAVLEASGGYERTMVQALRRAGLAVRVVDPKRVRRFAQAMGRLAKTDPIDAAIIAWFGEILPAQTQVAPDADRDLLAQLVGERQDFVEHRVQLTSRNEHPGSALAVRHRRAVLQKIDRAIAQLEQAIARKIARTPHLAEEARVLASFPGLGQHGVAAVIAWLPELGDLEDRQLAALVGVAPYDDASGERTGQAHIAGGRRQLRNILYMAAMAGATRHNPVLKEFYERLRATGKPAKVALIACLRKLLVILNRMLARGETWNPPKRPDAAAA